MLLQSGPFHTQYSIHSIKTIQQKTARFMFNDFARLSSVSTMLGLWTL